MSQQHAPQLRQASPNTRPSGDWLLDSKNKSVRHRSGLVIQLGKKTAPHKLAALEILQIEKLAGTPWANRSNLLIETGIALLSAL